MMPDTLTAYNADLQELRRFRTPIVYDAIERFGVRSNTDGYTDSTIKACCPNTAFSWDMP